MLAIRTILHPTDFSEPSEHAFRLACALARDHGARVLVLHVVPPPADREETARRTGVSFYERLWNNLRRLQAPDARVWVEYRMADGEPAREILRVADEGPCDLIVLSTHGRTGLRRLVMGSVAEEVLRAAPCPVLTLKAPFPDRQGPAPGEPEAVAACR